MNDYNIVEFKTDTGTTMWGITSNGSCIREAPFFNRKASERYLEKVLTRKIPEPQFEVVMHE